MESESPIHFLRQELMDCIQRYNDFAYDEDSLRTSIDLASENIIEHFNLNNK